MLETLVESLLIAVRYVALAKIGQIIAVRGYAYSIADCVVPLDLVFDA